MPFYLSALSDYRAARMALLFYQKALALNIDLADIDEALAEQNMKLGQLRARLPSVDRTITMLERNLNLADAESAELVAEVNKLFLI